jgi:hypothetical protein
VIGSRMIGALLQNILFAVALGHEIAIHTNVSAAYYLCHKILRTELRFNAEISRKYSIGHRAPRKIKCGALIA